MFGGLRSAVSEVTGQTNEGSNTFPKTLKTSAFFSGTVDLAAGEFGKLGEFVVPAQEAYRWGKGAAKFEANQGYLYINLKDDADAAVAATVRLQQRDAQERNIITVYEEEAEVLAGSKTDRTQQQALPLQDSYPKVGHNSKLVIAVRPDAAVTVSAANTEILAPVTVYPV